MKRLISLITMVITFAILVLSVVYTETIAPLGVAISVFLAIIFSHIDENTKSKCTEKVKHLAPTRTSASIQLLNTCLMVTYVFSNQFSIGITTDAKYSILWGLASGILVLASFGSLSSVFYYAEQLAPIDGKTQKAITSLKHYHIFTSITLTIFIIASVFAKFELLPCLLIINQVYVTHFALRE